MFVKLISLFALLAFVSSVQGETVVTTYFNDSTCRSSEPIARYVYLDTCVKRNVEEGNALTCLNLPGQDNYYYTNDPCASNTVPIANWQLITYATTKFCNDTYQQYLQVAEESKAIYVAFLQNQVIISVLFNTTCTNEGLDTTSCVGQCASYTLPNGECVAAGTDQFATQSSCGTAAPGSPVAESPAAGPGATPTASPIFSTPIRGPFKAPAKVSSASVIGGSALVVTLLALL